MTFVRENQIIPWQGVYFFTNSALFYKIIETYTVVMKNMINTIGKKIHTLVKENTPRRHKIRQEWVSLKSSHFSSYHCVFFPTVVRILVERLDLCFLTHTKKYMTPIHALIFEKHVKMCVYARHVKSQFKFVTLLGKYTQQKQVGWEVIFSELGFAGSRARKPRREFEGSALEPFFHVFLRVNGALIV